MGLGRSDQNSGLSLNLAAHSFSLCCHSTASQHPTEEIIVEKRHMKHLNYIYIYKVKLFSSIAVHFNLISYSLICIGRMYVVWHRAGSRVKSIGGGGGDYIELQ